MQRDAMLMESGAIVMENDAIMRDDIVARYSPPQVQSILTRPSREGKLTLLLLPTLPSPLLPVCRVVYPSPANVRSTLASCLAPTSPTLCPLCPGVSVQVPQLLLLATDQWREQSSVVCGVWQSSVVCGDLLKHRTDRGAR